jgi:endoglucanase
MDEVGFIILSDEKDGIFRFETVGGLDPRQLAGKAVVAGKKQIPGVIGLTPIHLTSAADRKQTAKTDSLRIDLGPKGNKVNPGDYATFAPNFMVIGRGASRSLRSKALDDRLGVATLIEIVKNAPENIDLVAAFTVQEEIGLRGAQVVAFDTEPDIAIALDTTPAHDLPPWDAEDENTRYNSKLGEGPALYTSDRGTLSDPRLIHHFAGVGDAKNIRYQYRQPGGGGTDAGALHKTGAGIPTLSISTPARYLHTAAGLIRLSDWQDTLALVHTGLSQLKPAILKESR